MIAISELFSDLKFIITFRRKTMKHQIELNRSAPKVGDQAPDFTLTDRSGKESITLSDFRGKKPVALIFGSFT
jgi:peroxiredoxin